MPAVDEATRYNSKNQSMHNRVSGNDSKVAEQRHQKLNDQRVKEGKLKMREANKKREKQASSRAGTRTRRTGRRKQTALQRATDLKRQAQTTMALGGAFTAIDPLKDWVHLFVIGIAVLADICTLIPVVGSLIAIIFIMATWMLYGLHGHFRKSPEKKIITTFLCYLIELIFSTSPTFLIAALANYWLALADRKVDQGRTMGELSSE